MAINNGERDKNQMYGCSVLIVALAISFAIVMFTLQHFYHV